jgi:hypothetical protein
MTSYVLQQRLSPFIAGRVVTTKLKLTGDELVERMELMKAQTLESSQGDDVGRGSSQLRRRVHSSSRSRHLLRHESSARGRPSTTPVMLPSSVGSGATAGGLTQRTHVSSAGTLGTPRAAPAPVTPVAAAASPSTALSGGRRALVLVDPTMVKTAAAAAGIVDRTGVSLLKTVSLSLDYNVRGFFAGLGYPLTVKGGGGDCEGDISAWLPAQPFSRRYS